MAKNEATPQAPDEPPAASPPPQLRLHRSSTNRIIGGVCGGLGEYFNIDANLIRILFILLVIFGGSGIILYVILWLILPGEGYETMPTNQHYHENIEDMKHEFRTFTGSWHDNTYPANRRYWLGLVIIAIGLLFLLNNFGLLYFIDLSRLWPLLLIILGIIVFLRQ